MPSTSRKRAAQQDINQQSPLKKPRAVRKKAAAHEPDPEVEVDHTNSLANGTPQPQPGGTLAIRTPQGAKSSKARKRANKSDKPRETEVEEIVDIEEVKVETSATDLVPATASPKKPRRQVKAETVNVEEEAHITTDTGTPKKSRTRKAIKQEEEVNAEGVVDGEAAAAAAPAKPKRKRKTQEEKDAEAMPLAARSTGLRMFIGAHVSGAKGVQNAVTNCVHIGGNAFALFLKSQRKWDNPPLQDLHRDGFIANCTQHRYDATQHIVPHGSYLVNLAQEDPTRAKQAYDSFVEDLRRCEALGIKLYNFHPGTTNNQPRQAAIARIASALNRALAETRAITPLLETMAGSGNVIGSTFADLASIIRLVDDKSRVGVCLDTCHLFAAGYDLRSPSSFAAVLRDLDEVVGVNYVKALHLNDSKAPFGSRRDLHANIGTGFLGLRAFWNVMNEERFEGLPMVLETPIDRKIEGGDEGKPGEEAVASDDGEEPEVDDEEDSKARPKKKKRPIKPPPNEKTVEDKSIWAREIKLLESLIGMDSEGEEFKKLEMELADQGAEERKKYQEAFDRKVAKEQKAETKDIGSFFVKGNAKEQKKKEGMKANSQKAETAEDDGSPLSELSDLSDSSEK